MKKMIINKEALSDYKTLSLILENCDVYEIPVEDILDVYCIAEPTEGERNEYQTKGGFIKIAARASQIREFGNLKDDEPKVDWDYCLKERLEMLDGGADMVAFSLRSEENREKHIYVPYNPLTDVMRDNEMELSNCPSFEVDDEGNMIIAFGEQSKQPKRKDNNYVELIEGWTEAFGDFQPKELKIKVKSWSTFGKEGEKFAFYFKICNKNSQIDFAELMFINCKVRRVEMFFPESGECALFMSKMADGKIYVGFDGLGIDFFCSSVQEYAYYCNRDED